MNSLSNCDSSFGATKLYPNFFTASWRALRAFGTERLKIIFAERGGAKREEKNNKKRQEFYFKSDNITVSIKNLMNFQNIHIEKLR